MKFEIAKEKLSSYLSQLSNVIEKNSPQPILTHIYLEATEDSKLKLAATDTEITLSAIIDAPIQETGKITVAAERFIPLINSLADKSSIFCEVIDGQFFVHTEGGKMKLATLPAEDFPIAENQEESNSFSIDASSFSEVLSRVRTAVAVNDIRQYLNGVFVKQINDNTIEAVATDGKRLALAQANTLNEGGDFSINSFILPIKAVSTLINLLSIDIAIAELKAQKEGLYDEEKISSLNLQIETLQKIKKSGKADADNPREIVLNLAERELRVEIGSYHFSTRLIEGEYPNYGQMIPQEKEFPIRIGKEDLLTVLRRIKVLFQKSKDKFVSMRFENQDMYLFGRNELDESVEQRLDMVESLQEEIPQISLNVDYFLACASQFDSAIVNLHIKDPDSPMMITAEDTPNLRFVVMPMRV